MRNILPSFGLAFVLLATGCNTLPIFRGTGDGPPPPQVGQAPTTASLVAYLNDNARRVESIDCPDLDLDAKHGLQPAIGLRGWMVCQKQRNFRMGAKLFGNDAVDMGSNNQEFWYWISKADPPHQFYCSYKDLEQGNVNMPFPFQPEWLMQAMGLAEYGAPEKYEVQVKGKTVELIEKTRSPQGLPIRKVTVFNTGAINATTPRVAAHLLQDDKGKLICGAYITEVQQDRGTSAIIPKKLRLEYPSERIELRLALNEMNVNAPITEQRATRLFSRPKLANVQSYDLAMRRIDRPTSSIQPTGGRLPGNR